MSTLQFYTERAAECRRDAEAAELDNVRQRNLNAAIAWEGMAARINRTEAQRKANTAARAIPEG